MKKIYIVLPLVAVIVLVIAIGGGLGKKALVTDDGIQMTLSEFDEYFRNGGPLDRETLTVPVQPKLTINRIHYDPDTRALSVSGSVLTGQNTNRAFSLSGKLYNSYKKIDGINSMAAILADFRDNFEILLFNIFDSTEAPAFLFDEELADLPHLKIYMQDKATDEMFFFETEIPQKLNGISIPLADDTICPTMLHDMIWFGNIIEPEWEFIKSTDDEIVTDDSGAA